MCFGYWELYVLALCTCISHSHYSFVCFEVLTSFLKIYLYNYVTCVYEWSICMSTCMTEEGIRFHYIWLWATTWLLGIELRISGRTTSAFNHWAISSPWFWHLECNMPLRSSLVNSFVGFLCFFLLDLGNILSCGFMHGVREYHFIIWAIDTPVVYCIGHVSYFHQTDVLLGHLSPLC